MTAAIAFILFAAAITPGPNNLIVMDAARRGGPLAALAPIAAVALGTVGLVLGLRFGLNAAYLEHPAAERVMRIAAACVLGYLAIRTVFAGWSKPRTRSEETPPYGTVFFTVLAFQIVNPKTWVLASAVATNHAAHSNASLLPLVAMTIFVPVCCLAVWAAAGQVVSRFFDKPAMQRGVSLTFALTFAALAAAMVLTV